MKMGIRSDLVKRVGMGALPIVSKSSIEWWNRDHPDSGKDGTFHDKNYYQILDVNPNVSQEEIEKAYRELTKKYHPDVSGEDENIQKMLNGAYSILGDREKRSLYDSFSSQRSRKGLGADITARSVDWDNPDNFLRDIGFSAFADLSRVPGSVIRIAAFWKWFKDGKNLPRSALEGGQMLETILQYIGQEGFYDRIKYRQQGDERSENLVYFSPIISSIMSGLALRMMSIDQRGRPKYESFWDKLRNYSGAALYTLSQIGNMIPWHLIAEGSNLAYKTGDVKLGKRPYNGRNNNALYLPAPNGAVA